jgi:hypothetical protein
LYNTIWYFTIFYDIIPCSLRRFQLYRTITIRHDVKSFLGIHLELGEHVKISNIQKIVNKTTLI